ncbi:DUF4179 domain-containing protein [Cohnella caldifontis]|uniref:DUF4179 domain-containing protein n=1 Tax=Cohnella caldifontis TaxID=3027471 RepID=UPI0023EBD647|nr:DUF4179 domain-containing protein [Cohnella sp. YIM B05605]
MSNPADEAAQTELSERIDAAIAEGIRRGQAEAARQRLRARRRLAAAAAACVILLACLLSIRVSPVFASMMRDIPGMDRFVDLIRDTQDKGVRLAVDNDFVQPVGASDEHDGIRFTVQGIIADDSRMVVFYETSSENESETVRLADIRPVDVSGKELPAMISYRYLQEEEQAANENGVYRGTVDISLAQEDQLPEEIILRTRMIRSDGPERPDAPPTRNVRDDEWSVPSDRDAGGPEYQVRFRIDRAKFQHLRREYQLGETIVAEGQRITFAKAVVTPLRVSLYVDYGEANPKQVFGAGDIRLVDDKGEVWATTSSSLVKDHPVIYFESPYFTEPKALYAEGSWFRALDKDRMTVTVDLGKRKVVSAPDGKLALNGVQVGQSRTRLDFFLTGVDPSDNMGYTLFESEFKDGTGKTRNMSDEGGVAVETRGDTREQHSYYYLDNADYPQPLTFKISLYPQYIRQPYKIRIK